jgi:hypothetical protein
MKLILDKLATDHLLRALAADDRLGTLALLGRFEEEGLLVATPVPQALEYSVTFATQGNPDIAVAPSMAHDAMKILRNWTNTTGKLPEMWYTMYVWKSE